MVLLFAEKNGLFPEDFFWEFNKIQADLFLFFCNWHFQGMEVMLPCLAVWINWDNWVIWLLRDCVGFFISTIFFRRKNPPITSWSHCSVKMEGISNCRNTHLVQVNTVNSKSSWNKNQNITPKHLNESLSSPKKCNITTNKQIPSKTKKNLLRHQCVKSHHFPY